MRMTDLNLPTYRFRYRNVDNQRLILDVFRKKYVRLTPEEWVRQNFLKFLVQEKGYPSALISVEHEFRLNRLSKRCDAVIFSKTGFPVLVIELKSPRVHISQKTFDQVYRYNIQIKAPYLIVSNGLKHYCCKVDFEIGRYTFLADIPTYTELSERDPLI